MKKAEKDKAVSAEEDRAVLVVVDLDDTLVTCHSGFFDDFLTEADSNKDKFSKSLCSSKEGLKIPSNYQEFGFAFNDYLIAYLIDLKQRYNNCKVILVTCNLSCKFIKMIVNDINLYYQSCIDKSNNVPNTKQNCCATFFSSLKRERLIDAFSMTGATDKRPELQRLCGIYKPGRVIIIDDQLDGHYSGPGENNPHKEVMVYQKQDEGNETFDIWSCYIILHEKNRIVLLPKSMGLGWFDIEASNDFAFKLDFYGEKQGSSTSTKSGQAITNIQRYSDRLSPIQYMTYKGREINLHYTVIADFHLKYRPDDKKREGLAYMVDQFDKQYKEKQKNFYKDELNLPDNVLENGEQPLFSSWLKNRCLKESTEDNVNSATALLKTGCSKSYS